MNENLDATDLPAILAGIRAHAANEHIRISQHAQQEMSEEDVMFDDVLNVLSSGHVLENYPEHRRGACCLLNGLTRGERPLHVVCTTTRSPLIVITVYEPKPPRWVTPSERRRPG